MKRIFLAIALLLSSQAWACDYELRIVQRDATDSGTFTRQICPVNGGTQPSLMVQDPFTGQVQMGQLVGFTWDGTTLTATGTQADWNATTGGAVILNKPTLSAVATTGAYSSLTGTPTLATVATSGSYTDLSNKPTIPVIAARVFSYPTRALSTCFQVSSSRDAQVTYAVDVTTTLTLTTGQQGSVALRTYTDSACTLGGQTVISGASGLPAALSVTVGLSNLGTVSLPSIIPAGAWVRIETTSTTGTPTFAARQGQEVLL
jgi:hypothetical protein